MQHSRFLGSSVTTRSVFLVAGFLVFSNGFHASQARAQTEPASSKGSPEGSSEDDSATTAEAQEAAASATTAPQQVTIQLPATVVPGSGQIQVAPILVAPAAAPNVTGDQPDAPSMGAPAEDVDSGLPPRPRRAHRPRRGYGPHAGLLAELSEQERAQLKEAFLKAHDPRTDHQKVVGKWGVEVRRLGVFNRSSRSLDRRCGSGDDTDVVCPIELNAIGVRRWLHERYAFSAALALAAGGGETPGPDLGSWDTHFGVGPVIGAHFLLAQSKHLAISAVPQVEFLAFLPSGSGSKTYMFNLRALVEAEIHLGFIGLPQLSLGTSAGLLFNYTTKTEPDVEQADSAGGATGAPFSAWDVGMTGPTSLHGLVNDVFLRFYF